MVRSCRSTAVWLPGWHRSARRTGKVTSGVAVARSKRFSLGSTPCITQPVAQTLANASASQDLALPWAGALWGARTRPLVLTLAFMRPARIR
jgi:hypothetical protein